MNFALIKTVGEIEMVMNVVVASQEVADTYLIANSGDYEYVLDTSLYDPRPGPGWSYDPGLNTFAPPPENFEAELESAIIAVDAALDAVLAAYTAASVGDRSTALGNVLSELSGSDSETKLDVMADVATWLEGEVS